MTRLVVFDLDGTLLDTIEDLGMACNHALRMCGCPERRMEEYSTLVGRGIYNLFRGALPPETATEELVMDMKRHFIPYYDRHKSDRTKPYPGIIPMLERLSQAGVRMAVASNKYQDGTEKLVREYFGKYTDDMSKPYVMFYPSNVSRNGRYVSLTVARDGSECRMARYDITTGEIEEYVADGSGTITAGMGSESLAAANDGTIAGNLMSSNQLVPYGRCACLWLPSAAEPVQLSSAYSEYQELAVYDEIGYNRLYDITPDGKMGLGLAYDEMYDYATYVIDLENITSSIDKVQAGEQDDSETERYTIDGTKISAPVKGLNIVKKADGTVVKVMVK